MAKPLRIRLRDTTTLKIKHLCGNTFTYASAILALKWISNDSIKGFYKSSRKRESTSRKRTEAHEQAIIKGKEKNKTWSGQ